MSTLRIDGIKPPDKEWLKMKTVYNSCNEAGVPVPGEVLDFFDNEPPDALGVLVPLAEQNDGDLDESKPCVEKYDAEEMSYGMELDLAKLPKDIKILRFTWIY